METNSFHFIELAKAEYDALHRYCNAMARMSHVVTDSSNRSVYTSFPDSNLRSSYQDYTAVDLRTMLARGYLVSRGLDPGKNHKNDSLQQVMEDYNDALTELRNAHVLLVDFVSNQRFENDQDVKISPVIDNRIRDWMMDHINLSTRIITTSASSSTSAGFGPLYENGILRDLNGSDDIMNQSWYHVRIISLATLQTNISKLRRNLMEIFGDR